jgi:phage shock protein PspC (stress-responsive transcriptional regulator)
MKSYFDLGSLDSGYKLDPIVNGTAKELEKIGEAGMTAAASLQGVGGAIGGIATIYSGFQQAEIDRKNALTMQYNAEQVKIMGDVQRRMQMQEATKILSKQKADRGAAGIELSGSALDVFMSSANEAFQDSANIVRATQAKADDYEQQAQQLYEKADSDIVGGVVGGLAKLAVSAATLGAF